MAEDGGETRLDLQALPEGCIAKILSSTGPLDACRLSLVSPTFRSAADSDALWEKFIPSDYHSIISRSNDSASLCFSSKKELFYSLSHKPILIDDSTKSFWLDKQSGKKCFMLAARDLNIVWGDTPNHWIWINLPESRFPEVTELIDVWWLEIRGKIDTSMLSPSTSYVAYLVFKFSQYWCGFERYPAEVSVGIAGSEGNISSVCLLTDEEERRFRDWDWDRTSIFRLGLRRPKNRRDGWLEIELGEYFNQCGEEGELEMSVMEVKGGIFKYGLIVQGIEIRPKLGP